VFLASALIVSIGVMMNRFAVFTRPSIVGTTFAAFVLMHGVSGVPYAASKMEDVLHVPVSPHFAPVLGLSFLLYTLGAVFMAGVVEFDLRKSQLVFFRRPAPAMVNLGLRLLAALVVLASITWLYALAAERTGIEMLVTTAREYFELVDFRIAQTEENPYHYVSVLCSDTFAPIALMCALNIARAERTLLSWVVVCIAVGVGVVSATRDLHKAPLIFLALFCVLSRFMTTTRTNVVRPGFVLRVCGIIGGLGLLGYYITYELRASEAAVWTVNRLVLAPQVGVDSFLFVYPYILPFNHGLGIGLVGRVFGWQYFRNPPAEVAFIMTGNLHTTFNAFWSTEMWASFGYAGVVIGSFVVGAVLCGLDAWLLRRRRTSAACVMYAFLIIASVRGMSTSFFTTLLSGGLVLGPLFLMFLTGRLKRDELAAAGKAVTGRHPVEAT
jgi:hypothetical protein